MLASGEESMGGKKEFWQEEPKLAGLLVAQCLVHCSLCVLY